MEKAAICCTASVAYWHETDMPMQSPDVGCWGMSGPVPDAVRLPKMTHKPL